MNNMTLQQLYVTLLVGGLVLLASIVATRAAAKVGLPSLLLFLAVGVALGNDGLGWNSTTSSSPATSAPRRWPSFWSKAD
ncbi:putative membrane protein [Mycobacterium intracellulare]|nr:putative membrane protein [Mycobacterium intracellulare]